MFSLSPSPSFRFFLLLITFLPLSGFAQNSAASAVDLFLDCEVCDQGYIRQEFQTVNYVRTQQDAMVHLLITRQWTAGGGATYELQFLGKGEFEGMNNQLFFSTEPNESSDDVRERHVKNHSVGHGPLSCPAGHGRGDGGEH